MKMLSFNSYFFSNEEFSVLESRYKIRYKIDGNAQFRQLFLQKCRIFAIGVSGVTFLYHEYRNNYRGENI